MIAPTVGRVVYFIPKEECYQFGYCVLKGKPHAAIVAAVHGDRMVNLSIFDANGKQFSRTSVTLRQPEDTVPGGDYCEWMPFQVGQSQAVKEAQKEVPAAA